MTVTNKATTQQTITSIKQMLLVIEQHMEERELTAAGQRDRARRQIDETLAEMRTMMQTIQERLDSQDAILATLTQAIATLYGTVIDIRDRDSEQLKSALDRNSNHRAA